MFIMRPEETWETAVEAPLSSSPRSTDVKDFEPYRVIRFSNITANGGGWRRRRMEKEDGAEPLMPIIM